ncbi:MAG: 23S rRNA (guanosine(2251)-2'-O)-methyltransferase RlmB [Bacillota bacterium]|nr:23S rRNA (guanosine(2251)-2'-O)-methyltransferase RlmB [Bacillota bacterium]
MQSDSQKTEGRVLFGRNVVRELIKSGRSVDKLLVARGETDGSLRQLSREAKETGIVVIEVSRSKLDELCMAFGHSGRTGNHQGVAALLPAHEYASVEEILTRAEKSARPPFVIVCDGITDPMNLGSILRSAECFGAHGVIIPKRRNASLSAAAAKAASGAEEYVAVARVPNIVQTLEELKRKGLWIAGADMEGREAGKTDLKGAVALVIGGEGEGLARLTKEKCDLIVKIPMTGSIGSLNAAVAAAVLMYEKKRQEGF